MKTPRLNSAINSEVHAPSVLSYLMKLYSPMALKNALKSPTKNMMRLSLRVVDGGDDDAGGANRHVADGEEGTQDG